MAVCMYGILGSRELSREIAGTIYVRPFLSPVCVCLFSRNSLERFWGQVIWHLWIGMARNPAPSVKHVAVEVFNVGGWLTHGILALEAQVDLVAALNPCQSTQ